ncbi:MAG TPA: hypothetical protein VMN99_02175 [Anaerolineales bacterium]|nr:hypothetical protein [Anaerolineales bacterium]
MSEAAYNQVVRSGRIKLMGPVHAYDAEPVIWQSTVNAVTDARTWLVGLKQEGSTTDSSQKMAAHENQ